MDDGGSCWACDRRLLWWNADDVHQYLDNEGPIGDLIEMEINFITTLGLTAGVLTTIAYLPQLIKTWKTKSADDLSWSMLIVLCIGIILWLIYGVIEQDIPLIFANVVTFIFALIILILKIRYQPDSSEDSDD